MHFLDLFSGIGGFRLGMEMAGHKCLGYVEKDEFARNSYQAIHDTKGEWTANDITKVSDDDFRLFRGKADVICGGFPCQAFSIAGKRGGFKDTRGTLFFDIARAVKEIEPRYIFLENVKGLLSHEEGRTYGTIISTLDELGYDCEWQVLNSKNFGVPQNRERVFIIGHLRGSSSPKIFPFRGKSNVQIKEVGKIYPKRHSSLANSIISIDGLCPTLDTMQGGNREPKIQFIDKQGNFKVRKLTPLECWRLQGFPDEKFHKAAALNSDSQLYKQAGNSVTVNVIKAIAEKLE